MRLKSTTSGSSPSLRSGESSESVGSSLPLDSSASRSSSPAPDTATDADAESVHAENREPPKPIVVRPIHDPNHPHRIALMNMWNILVMLGLRDMDDSLFILMHMKRWDQWLVEWIEHPLVNKKSKAMCILLQQIFNALRLPLTPVAAARTDAQTNLIRR